MGIADLGSNLRLLCSYGKSNSEICRRAGINRHQLQRYLNGTTSPSMHTLRRLGDFFGLEEHEMLLPHGEFAALVRVRPPRLQRTRDRIADYMGAFVDHQDLGIAAHYEGYYHVYFQPDRLVPQFHRALTRVRIEDRCLITRTVERYPGGFTGLPHVVKYDGIAFTAADTLRVIERRATTTASMFYTILYGADADELTFLSGLVMGVAPDSSRTVYSLRTCWHYLGRDVDRRKRMRQCGQFPLDDSSVSRHVRHCIENDLNPGEESFSPRF